MAAGRGSTRAAHTRAGAARAPFWVAATPWNGGLSFFFLFFKSNSGLSLVSSSSSSSFGHTKHSLVGRLASVLIVRCGCGWRDTTGRGERRLSRKEGRRVLPDETYGYGYVHSWHQFHTAKAQQRRNERFCDLRMGRVYVRRG